MGRTMVMNLKLSLMALVAFLAISGTCIAGSADPVIGTWKLNAAKSTGASIPKSETRTYAAASDGIKLTYKRVGADGAESTVESTYKYDGNDYPVKGSSDFDTLSVKRVDAHTIESSQKKMGKPVGTTRRTVSADGKTLTLASKLTSATGATAATTLVYDRQ
jgi:hypothetical protein